MARNSIKQPGPEGNANKEIEDKIVRSRVQLLLNHPFYGNLATRLKIVNGSGWVPTAGTDGRHLYYNEEFFSKMTREEIDFVVAHEVMHCVYDHMSRRGSRDPRLWNCAGDYVINQELVDNRIGRLPTTVDGLYDTRFRNMFTEEIFEILKEEADNGKGDPNADSFDLHIDMSPDGDGEGAGKECDSTGNNGPIPLS
jgi:predicted metal-dependent peptidase